MENIDDHEIDQNLEAARQLIEQLKKQFGYESERIMKYKQEIWKEKDFKVSRVYYYNGPNFFLDRQAVVFNLFIAPSGDSVDFFKSHISKYLPVINDIETPYVVDLFTQVLIQVMKMDIDLYINKYSITTEGDDYVIAVEYLDSNTAKECVYFVSEWFKAITEDTSFDFTREWLKIQDSFDKTLFGGPTLYSLIEAGLKRNIPVLYLYEENQFMWGYCKKQLRGRSTTFHNDGIKDTEFTMFKDMVGEFLLKRGFPTPAGINCYDEDKAVEIAQKLDWPVVVKPVSGHKGKDVTTGITTENEVREAFRKVVHSASDEMVNFDGVLVQKQIFGSDHRLLSVNGKFTAALKRVPAYVDGDGVSSIGKLIEEENNKTIRLDNARSPLCKIKIDDNLKEFLALQQLSLESVPQQGERITLRRVANISAGGVSINVTENIHPLNIKLVEDIARYFNVRCLGIDILAKDISKPWSEGDFGIIEINAGPGVFMHLTPAYGSPVDCPGIIIMSHFGKAENSRIPIITGNNLSQFFADRLYEKLQQIKPDLFFSSITRKGLYNNGEYFFNNPDHRDNVENLLRNPGTEFALINHTSDDIYDFGTVHRGADLIILDDADYCEEKVLKEQLLPGGHMVIVEEGQVYLKKDDIAVNTAIYNPEDEDEKDHKILQIIEPLLEELVRKYE
ncbi:MAG: acetate--CoA ligase family protein [Bacteroidota bacterium]